MARTFTKEDKAAAIERLKEWLKDGDKLYFILRHRSESGMSRIYSVKHFTPKAVVDQADMGVADLSSNIAMACEYAWVEPHWGVKVNGCGFSGEQDIADSVGRLLGMKLRYETL